MMTLAMLRLGLPYDIIAALPAEEAREYLACANAVRLVGEERAKEEAWLSRVVGGF